MKKLAIIYYLIFFTSSMTSFVHAENMLTKMRDYFYTTRLFAGYHSTPAEKAAAQEKIKQLSTKRDELKNSLATADNEQDKQTIRTKLAKINKQIYKQKIILGQEWTKERKGYWAGAGILGLEFLGIAELYFRGSQSYIYKTMPLEAQSVVLKLRYLLKNKQQLADELNKIDKDITQKQNAVAKATDDGDTLEVKRLEKEIIILQDEKTDIDRAINRK